LRADTIAAVNDGRIPQLFQEELLGSVAALVDSIECLPPAEPPEEQAGEAEVDEEDDEGRGKDKGKGKAKGKGKKKGRGKD
jgi:hypothetical protein